MYNEVQDLINHVMGDKTLIMLGDLILWLRPLRMEELLENMNSAKEVDLRAYC